MRLIHAFFFMLICAGLVQAQQAQSMDSAIKAFRNAKEKMASKEQLAELRAELTPKQASAKEWVSKSRALEKKINSANKGTDSFRNAPTNGDVLEAISIHKGSRAAKFEIMDVYQRWGQRYGRMGCVRQVQNAKSFLMDLSNKWANEMAGIPLGDETGRGYAAIHIAHGRHLGASFSEFIQQAEIVSVCDFGGDEKDPSFIYHKSFPGEE